MFADESASLEIIRDLVRKRLLAPETGGLVDDAPGLEESTVLSGTEDWDCFRAFVFDEDGLEILFAPYQVACYAAGPEFVKLPHKEFAHLLSRPYRNALGA
jgi:hypothetical protein